MVTRDSNPGPLERDGRTDIDKLSGPDQLPLKSGNMYYISCNYGIYQFPFIVFVYVQLKSSKMWFIYSISFIIIILLMSILSYLILLILHYICHYSCYKIKTQLGLIMISGQITHPLEKLLKTFFIYTFTYLSPPFSSLFFHFLLV